MAIRVLLADDHTVVREGIRSLLEREKLTVVAEASNGREAVIAAEATRPDVAVLDLTMPVLNGFDAHTTTLAPPSLSVKARFAVSVVT